jgi:hypothetical protein
MYKTRWANTLLKLRYNHLDEIKRFYLDERCLLVELRNLCQARLLEAKKPFDKTEAIRCNWLAVKDLRESRDRRYVALRNRHKEEIENFLAFREEFFSVQLGWAMP